MHTFNNISLAQHFIIRLWRPTKKKHKFLNNCRLYKSQRQKLPIHHELYKTHTHTHFWYCQKNQSTRGPLNTLSDHTQ